MRDSPKTQENLFTCRTIVLPLSCISDTSEEMNTTPSPISFLVRKQSCISRYTQRTYCNLWFFSWPYCYLLYFTGPVQIKPVSLVDAKMEDVFKFDRLYPEFSIRMYIDDNMYVCMYSKFSADSSPCYRTCKTVSFCLPAILVKGGGA